MRLEHWRVLSPEQQQSFPPLCPDLVGELTSPSAQGPRGLGVQAVGRGRPAGAFHAAVSALYPAGGGPGSADAGDGTGTGGLLPGRHL